MGKSRNGAIFAIIISNVQQNVLVGMMACKKPVDLLLGLLSSH